MSAKGTGKVEGSTCARCVLTLPSQSDEDLIKSGKRTVLQRRKKIIRIDIVARRKIRIEDL